MTHDEMGGSEYYEHYHKIIGGKVPVVDLINQNKIFDAIKAMLNTRWVSAVHDCSKGGIIISLLELSIQSNLGFTVDVDKIPNTCKRMDYILFSETHNRFIISTKHSNKIKDYLSGKKFHLLTLARLQTRKIVY